MFCYRALEQNLKVTTVKFFVNTMKLKHLRTIS